MTGKADDLPPRPIPPRPDECCNSGCVRCVYDLYDEALARWEETMAARIDHGNRGRSCDADPEWE